MGLMGRIDAPLFHDVLISCFDLLILVFHSPLGSLVAQQSSKHRIIYVVLYSHRVRVILSFVGTHFPIEQPQPRRRILTQRVRTAGCKPAPETKVAFLSLVQVCVSSCLPLFTSCFLHICEGEYP